MSTRFLYQAFVATTIALPTFVEGRVRFNFKQHR